LSNVDADLCAAVARQPGPARCTDGVADRRRHPITGPLSQLVTRPGPIAGRVIGVVAVPGADLAGISKLRAALTAEQAVLRVIAPIGGTLTKGSRTELIERTLVAARSIECDAILFAHGADDLADINTLQRRSVHQRHHHHHSDLPTKTVPW
jgi:catalase